MAQLINVGAPLDSILVLSQKHYLSSTKRITFFEGQSLTNYSTKAEFIDTDNHGIKFMPKGKKINKAIIFQTFRAIFHVLYSAILPEAIPTYLILSSLNIISE
jgi:hypothetical protein